MSAPVVAIRFPLYGSSGYSQTYCYFTHVSDLEVGDYVVVEVERAGGHPKELRVGKVADTNPKDHQRRRATKWIVDKVDLDVHRARTALIESMEGEDHG